MRHIKRICQVISSSVSYIEIPCKHFNGGYGVCPFGECCFYSHKLANGQDYSSRMVMQSDGELRDIGCVVCWMNGLMISQCD